MTSKYEERVENIKRNIEIGIAVSELMLIVTGGLKPGDVTTGELEGLRREATKRQAQSEIGNKMREVLAKFPDLEEVSELRNALNALAPAEARLNQLNRAIIDECNRLLGVQ